MRTQANYERTRKYVVEAFIDVPYQNMPGEDKILKKISNKTSMCMIVPLEYVHRLNYKIRRFESWFQLPSFCKNGGGGRQQKRKRICLTPPSNTIYNLDSNLPRNMDYVHSLVCDVRAKLCNERIRSQKIPTHIRFEVLTKTGRLLSWM
jgi:hypothetical protein